MKKINYLLIALCMITTSCIDMGLNELPVYHDAELLDFEFEYRYIITNTNNVNQLAVKKLITLTTIQNDKILAEISIPDPSGTFTSEIAGQITLSNIVGYAEASIGSSIIPIDGAPKLGTQGNFSSAVKYKVVAADGTTSKTYILTTILE